MDADSKLTAEVFKSVAEKNKRNDQVKGTKNGCNNIYIYQGYWIYLIGAVFFFKLNVQKLNPKVDKKMTSHGHIEDPPLKITDKVDTAVEERFSASTEQLYLYITQASAEVVGMVVSQ